jgi:hypothetical protein
VANRLFIYIPFARIGHCNVKDNAQEFKDATLPAQGIVTHDDMKVVKVKLIYLNEEPAASDIDQQDIVLIHAHGDDTECHLYSNTKPQQITRIAGFITRLDKFKNAGAFYFAFCYSSLPGHAAALWKKKYKQKNVYGYEKKFGGGLATTFGGRGPNPAEKKIRATVVSKSSAQLSKLI